MIEFRVRAEKVGGVNSSRFTFSKVNRIFFSYKTVYKTALAGGGIHYADLDEWVVWGR